MNLSEMAHLIFSTEFAERILPFDTRAAECFALLAAEAKQKGHTPGFADVQIASIAMAQGAVVVTRNTKDFVFEGVEIQNPWKS